MRVRGAVTDLVSVSFCEGDIVASTVLENVLVSDCVCSMETVDVFPEVRDELCGVVQFEISLVFVSREKETVCPESV